MLDGYSIEPKAIHAQYSSIKPGLLPIAFAGKFCKYLKNNCRCIAWLKIKEEQKL